MHKYIETWWLQSVQRPHRCCSLCWNLAVCCLLVQHLLEHYLFSGSCARQCLREACLGRVFRGISYDLHGLGKQALRGNGLQGSVPCGVFKVGLLKTKKQINDTILIQYRPSFAHHDAATCVGVSLCAGSWWYFGYSRSVRSWELVFGSAFGRPALGGGSLWRYFRNCGLDTRWEGKPVVRGEALPQSVDF